MNCPKCGKEMIAESTLNGNYYCSACRLGLNDLVYRETLEKLQAGSPVDEPGCTDALIAIKDQEIKKLQEQVVYYKNTYEGTVKNYEYVVSGLKELSFNLYVALAKTLEKQGMVDNIPSAIDQLIGKNCGKYADMYNEYKNYKNKIIKLKDYISEYYDDGMTRPESCNEYIKATCKDILEKMRELNLIERGD